jgi:hypothetical protein
MIIFEKLGGGQAERRGNVPVSSDRPVGNATLLALPVPTKEGTKEVSPSQTSKGLSHSTLAAQSGAPMRRRITASPRSPWAAAPGQRPPLSNRELELLERGLSYCKQRLATVSNRELWTIRDFAAPSRSVRDRTADLLRGPRVTGRRTRPLPSFLPGSAQNVECDVTPTKQTTATFLPGATTACFVEGTSGKRTAQMAPADSLENRLPPALGARLWTQSAAGYNEHTNHNKIISSEE